MRSTSIRIFSCVIVVIFFIKESFVIWIAMSITDTDVKKVTESKELSAPYMVVLTEDQGTYANGCFTVGDGVTINCKAGEIILAYLLCFRLRIRKDHLSAHEISPYLSNLMMV